LSPPPEGRGPIASLSDDFVTRAAALDPIAATFEGIHGHDAELTDYSPSGVDERLQHARATLRELATQPAADDPERIAAEVLRRYLESAIELTETGEELRPLRVIGSPVSEIRLCFDLMPRESEEDWRNIASRLRLVPQGLTSYRASLIEGTQRQLTAAQRQAIECATQAEVWSGQRQARPFFDGHDDAQVVVVLRHLGRADLRLQVVVLPVELAHAFLQRIDVAGDLAQALDLAFQQLLVFPELHR